MILLTYTVAISQNWTEPVNVSNMNDFILSSDFTIDNEGIIHCVWNLKYDLNYGIILYTYSEDDGNTWSDAISISQNDTNYCTSPSIVHDSQNNLYVVYDLNNYDPQNWGSYACFVKKDTQGWAEPLILSEGLETRITIDANDRVYVIWHMGAPNDGEFYYKYLEEETWSELICPYDNEELTFLNKAVVDVNNNMHAVGINDNNDGTFEPKVIYMSYDYSGDQWSDLTFLSEGYNVRDSDIALDTNQLPHICWEEGATYYSYYNGTQWSEKEAVASANTYRVDIEIDNSNHVHIATTEETEEQMNLVYYHRPDGINWQNMIIDQGNNVIFYPEFEKYDRKLYTVYDKSDSVPYGDIYISKLDLLTSYSEWDDRIIKRPGLIQNFPNPFYACTSISFQLTQPSFVKLIISDLNGKELVSLSEGKLNEGAYDLQWCGENMLGDYLQPGIYLYTLITDRYFVTRKLIYKP